MHRGEVVFTGTPVPVENFIGYLEHGELVQTFLEDFPTIERWQVEAVLDLSLEAMARMGGQGADSSRSST